MATKFEIGNIHQSARTNSLYVICKRSAKFVTVKHQTQDGTVETIRKAIRVRGSGSGYESFCTSSQRDEHGELDFVHAWGAFCKAVRHSDNLPAFVVGMRYSLRPKHGKNFDSALIIDKTDFTVKYRREYDDDIREAIIVADEHGEYFFPSIMIPSAVTIHAEDFIDPALPETLYEDDCYSDQDIPEIPAIADDSAIASDNDNAMASQPAHVATAESLPPDNLYMEESYSDTPGDNSCPDDDIPECHTPDSFSGNPGLTVIPTEHISRPDYRQTHDTPINDCPCVNVTACCSPAHSPAAALVPYAQAAEIRNFLHIISIYLRMWVALHISRPVLRFEDFPDGIFTHCTTRKKPRAKFRRAEFEVGSSYTATCYSPTKGLQSFTFLVTGRCAYEDTYDKTKGVMLFVTCNSPEDHAFEGRGVLRCIHTEHGVEYYEHRKGYEMGYGDIVFTFRADKRDNVPFPFKNTAPIQPGYMPCGYCTRFISRDFLNYSDNPAAVLQPLEFASDFKEVNKIRRENKAMIDACDSEEKIAALMLSLNKKDILNQADYCRVSLFNAHVKSDTQLAREFAAAIMKRRQKKTRKTKPATAHDEKLINLDGLHENERRNARNHNIALLSACMFPEAVISLLMSATVHTVKSLGIHLGYMCKTMKGEKKFLAEKFAAEMFRIRNRKKPVAPSAVQTAKQPPHVPDGVKFEVNKKRQICFSFTE